MKKLIFLIAIVALFTVNTVSAQRDATISWPFGVIDTQTKTDRLTSALTVTNRLTWVDYGTLDTTMTITVTPVSGLQKGAFLFILTKSNTTARTVNFSTGFKATALSGTISKTKLATFIYNGTYFYCVTTQQVD